MDELRQGERIDYLIRENLSIIQSKEVFSFSLDAVLLSYFAKVPRTRKATIVDLCSGNGAVSFMLSHKTNNSIVGVELQEQLIDMANRSNKLNQLEDRIRFIQADIRDLKNTIPKDSVDYITCNPPYFQVNEQSKVHHTLAYRLARHEMMLSLEEVLYVMSGLLKMKAKAYMVHRPDRLGDIVTLARKHRLEPKRVQLVYPKQNRNANIVLVELMKDGAPGGMVLVPPIVVFEENQEYTAQMRDILFGEE